MTNPLMSTSAATPQLGDLFLPTFLKLASVQPGERVLDLCGGDGAAVIEAAHRSGEQGEQLVFESNQERLDALLARARQEGARTLRGEACDATRIPGPDSYWDIVLCHLVLPLLADPEAALRDALRVLRPVGRIAVSIFGQRERCPLITIFLDALAPYAPAAKEIDHRLFRYSAMGKLATTLAEAGCEDAVPERLTEWPAFADVDEYWRMMATDSRFAGLASALTEDEVAAAKRTIEAKTTFYRRRAGMELKVEGVVLAAVK